MTTVAKGLAALVCSASVAVLVVACKPGAQQASAQDAPPPLAALPLTNAAPRPSEPGPVAVDLPRARPVPIGPVLRRDQGYAYLDRAYFLNDAFGEAPPDYGFYYDEEYPWVWETDDGFIRVVEFLPYGDRYYYYEPGADYPFLICDPDYDYAYADGELVAVYDSSGALLPYDDFAVHAAIAGRELARAEAIFPQMTRDREPVSVSAWTARRGQLATEFGQWRQREQRQPAWRSFHQARLDQEQAHWAPERFRREAEAARTAQRIHDPDGAQHAWSEANRAADVARKAHVNLPLSHGRAGGQAGAQTRTAMNSGRPGRGAEAGRPGGGPGAMALRGQGQAGRGGLERGAPGRMAAAERGGGRFGGPERGRPERLAMAQNGLGARAQYNVRGRERAFESRGAPRVRAAERFGPSRHERPTQFARSERNFGGPRFGGRQEAPRHLQIVQAPRERGPRGGGGGYQFRGGNPGGRFEFHGNPGGAGGRGGYQFHGGGNPGGGYQFHGNPGGGGGHGGGNPGGGFQFQGNPGGGGGHGGGYQFHGNPGGGGGGNPGGNPHGGGQPNGGGGGDGGSHGGQPQQNDKGHGHGH